MLYNIQISSCEEMQTQLRYSLNALLQQLFILKIFGDATVLCWWIGPDTALVKPSVGTGIVLVTSP